jgi:phage-related protein
VKDVGGTPAEIHWEGDSKEILIGKGVWELKESDERAWYRIVYRSKIGSFIYVLHCFEKES